MFFVDLKANNSSSILTVLSFIPTDSRICSAFVTSVINLIMPDISYTRGDIRLCTYAPAKQNIKLNRKYGHFSKKLLSIGRISSESSVF